ncbi:hypothetical protein PI125_g18464 [Phytophthora idaei]|nr:hypothetical protein PI125_g18464 [Phytophthora idaei]
MRPGQKDTAISIRTLDEASDGKMQSWKRYSV